MDPLELLKKLQTDAPFVQNLISVGYDVESLQQALLQDLNDPQKISQ